MKTTRGKTTFVILNLSLLIKLQNIIHRPSSNSLLKIYNQHLKGLPLYQGIIKVDSSAIYAYDVRGLSTQKVVK